MRQRLHPVEGGAEALQRDRERRGGTAIGDGPDLEGRASAQRYQCRGVEAYIDKAPARQTGAEAGCIAGFLADHANALHSFAP